MPRENIKSPLPSSGEEVASIRSFPLAKPNFYDADRESRKSAPRCVRAGEKMLHADISGFQRFFLSANLHIARTIFVEIVGRLSTNRPTNYLNRVSYILSSTGQYIVRYSFSSAGRYVVRYIFNRAGQYIVIHIFSVVQVNIFVGHVLSRSRQTYLLCNATSLLDKW